MFLAQTFAVCLAAVCIRLGHCQSLYQATPDVAELLMADDAFDLEMELLCWPATGGSCQKMHKLCERISKACTGVPAHIRELSQLPNTTHRERDLHRWVKRQPWRKLLPDAYEFDIPYTADGILEALAVHSVFLPHETLSHIYREPELLEDLLCGPEGCLDTFWENTAASDPEWRSKHPVAELHTQPSTCIPIGIHGDDAGLYQSEKMLIITWNSLATQHLTLDSRILFGALTYAHAVPGKTVDVLYEVLAWSLNCIAEGRFPWCDHRGRLFSREHHPDRFRVAGSPLTAAGHRGIFAELRGDWKWQVECLGFDQWYNTNFVCHLCRAHVRIKRLLYTQFRRNDHIRRTRVRHHNWRDWNTERGRPHLSRVVGFGIWRCLPDAMHCLDLGVYQNLAAACLYELVVEGVWPGDEQEDAFNNAHLQYKEWCKAKGTPSCCRFEMSKIAPGKPLGTTYPHFTQQTAKGAMTKHLIVWLADVLTTRVAVTRHMQLRFVLFASLRKFEDACERNGRFLPVADREIVAVSMEQALVCLNELHAEDIAAMNFVWHIIPKCHMATHLAYDFAGRAINPRRTTCYSDEDMVGKVKKIMTHCHAMSAGRRVLERYAILIGTRWWVRLAELRGLR